MRGFCSRRGPGLTLVHSLGGSKSLATHFTKADALGVHRQGYGDMDYKHIQLHCYNKKRETEVSLSH